MGRFHRIRMGTADGKLFEVFNPPWWRLDLWLRWWLTKRPTATISFWIDGEEVELRAWAIKNNLPFCAEYDVGKEDRQG